MICSAKLASIALGAVLATGTVATHADEQKPQQLTAGNRTLDLKPPLITRIFTLQQIDMILARAVDPQLEHVEVEATRVGDLPLTDKSASTGEVVFKEVVRWFAPYPTTLAAQVNAAPDMTDSYRPVPVLMSSYHAGASPPYSQR